MPKRKDVVAEQLHALADDLEELWKALTRDPAAERRKLRIWSAVSGLLGVVATMASRRAVTKLWPILTGEQPPTPRMPQPAAQRETAEREEAPTATR
jgi:hypothetical protein